MIEKLTKDQIARFPEFVEKWTAIGLSTQPANRPEAEKGVIEAYRVAGLAAPRIVWCGSPLTNGLTRAAVLSCADKVASVGDSVGASVRASVGDSVRDSVRASVGDSVWDSVRDSVGDSVWASVWDSVRDSVRASVWDSVGDSVRDSVRDSVWDSVGGSVRDSVGDSGYGQHDANWIGFYDFLSLTCGLSEQTIKLSGLHQLTVNAGWYLPHKDICWIAERHNVLHRNAQGRLHKDEGAALAYPDGFSIYALNGIRMKEEYVMTPAEKLEPKMILAETNVEIRRELLRKIGIERFLAVAKHKVLDTQGDYELLSIELTPEIKDARYLKMTNPSVKCFHIEGVHPSCNTVQHSINWRASEYINKEWKPAILT